MGIIHCYTVGKLYYRDGKVCLYSKYGNIFSAINRVFFTFPMLEIFPVTNIFIHSGAHPRSKMCRDSRTLSVSFFLNAFTNFFHPSTVQALYIFIFICHRFCSAEKPFQSYLLKWNLKVNNLFCYLEGSRLVFRFQSEFMWAFPIPI